MKPREQRAPAKWIRSRTGCLAQVIRTTKTTKDGLWLYRLQFQGDVSGSMRWTLDELQAQGVRWLTRRPAAWSEVG